MRLHDFAKGGILCAAMLAFPVSAGAQGSDIGKQILRKLLRGLPWDRCEGKPAPFRPAARKRDRLT